MVRPTSQLRTSVLLSYVSSIALFLYQFIAWNYDIEFFSDHGILLRLQTVSRNEFTTLALSQYLPFACNTIAILYESPLIFSFYSIYAVVVFAYTLYEWWVPYIFGCCGRWDDIGFDRYHLEYGIVHRYKVLPELVKGYPISPGLEQIGFSLILCFNVVVSVYSVVIIAAKTLFAKKSASAKTSSSSTSSSKKPFMGAINTSLTGKIGVNQDEDITKIESPVDKIKLSDFLGKDPVINNITNTGSNNEDDSVMEEPLDSLASEPSKALFVKKRNKKKSSKK